MREYRVLCYGDSNTWGFTPGSGVRLDENSRWPALLAAQLGEGYRVVEDGIIGRTTVYDDPVNPYRNGLTGLGYSLQTHCPLDLVILFLGTNDLQFTDLAGVIRGVKELLRTLNNANAIFTGSTRLWRGEPKILLVAPPALHEDHDRLRPDTAMCGRVADSRRFAQVYAQIAPTYGAAFVDAGAVACASAVDAIHMDAHSHRRLAAVLCGEVRRLMEDPGCAGGQNAANTP